MTANVLTYLHVQTPGFSSATAYSDILPADITYVTSNIQPQLALMSLLQAGLQSLAP